MTDRPWLGAYPQGVPADIDPTQYTSLVELMEQAFRDYADRTAYSFMGKETSYRETDALSRQFAAYLQSLGLAQGDRVAMAGSIGTHAYDQVDVAWFGTTRS